MNNTWLENRILKKIKNFLLPEVSTSDSGKTVVVDNNGQWGLGNTGSAEDTIYIATIQSDLCFYDSVNKEFFLRYTIERSDGGTFDFNFLKSNPATIIADIPSINFNTGTIDYTTNMLQVIDNTFMSTEYDIFTLLRPLSKTFSTVYYPFDTISDFDYSGIYFNTEVNQLLYEIVAYRSADE